MSLRIFLVLVRDRVAQRHNLDAQISLPMMADLFSAISTVLTESWNQLLESRKE